MDWVQTDGIAKHPNLWVWTTARLDLHALWTVKVLTTELILDELGVSTWVLLHRTRQLHMPDHNRRVLNATGINAA